MASRFHHPSSSSLQSSTWATRIKFCPKLCPTTSSRVHRPNERITQKSTLTVLLIKLWPCLTGRVERTAAEIIILWILVRTKATKSCSQAVCGLEYGKVRLDLSFSLALTHLTIRNRRVFSTVIRTTNKRMLRSSIAATKFGGAATSKRLMCALPFTEFATLCPLHREL